MHWVELPYLRQLPAPSQVPSRPQLDGDAIGHALGTRGGAPAWRDKHCPTLSATLQVLHASVQAWLQQTPSGAQKPDAHWGPQVQVSPFARLASPVAQLASGPSEGLPSTLPSNSTRASEPSTEASPPSDFLALPPPHPSATIAAPRAPTTHHPARFRCDFM
jgi:hypothetical protein